MGIDQIETRRLKGERVNESHWQLWLEMGFNVKVMATLGGIRKVIVCGKEEVELGYALMPEFWGQGLAVEIGEKALLTAFDRFNYSSVVCYTLVSNKKSERVMQKIGFVFERNIIEVNQPHILYRYQNPNYSTP